MLSTISRWTLPLYFLIVSIVITYAKDIRIVCYYTNWSVYRPGTAKFSPQNINPYLCTHLVYAFGGFTKENTLKPFDKYQDIEKGGYAKFTGLKTYNKNLKTLLAIGGWNEGSSRFSPMVANADRRKELVKNAIKFLRQNHFDGLDLDWEYPSFRDGGKPRDRDNYALLVQELREEFERESEKTGRPRLLLTMAVPAGIEYINKGYDVPKLTKYLDWMNILSYDYHSAFEPAVNHHAPLFPLEEVSEYNYDGELNIDYTIKHYLEAGAEASKLVLGLPTYGRSYTLYNAEANEIGAPADGPGDMGDATRENGYLAYYEICEYVKNNDWKVETPNPRAMGPYAYKENQWVSYDDEDIIRKKSEYVAKNGLGGIMFWSIDNDDFRGNCHGKAYPLIEAGKEALISALGLTEENAISEPAKPIKHKPRTRGRYTTPSTKEDSEPKVQISGANRSRNRLKIKKHEEQSESRNKVTIKKDRLNTRRNNNKETPKQPEPSTAGSSLVVTPSYTTPAPPTTPDPGSDFKCEDEGFFPHPRDCKKYFWCLSSGPSDLGIVAHQFTCPSGLYFNKAADSCDYTQNVLCRKKSTSTTTTTTTTTTTAKSSGTVATTKAPVRITAATSRTTLSSTTPEPEYEEYEYEDEEEDVSEEKKGVSEEDPKVIKELLDLIKRAGGIEELEKQLKIHDDGTASLSGSGSTTQSSIISKSLYERVLSRAAGNKSSEDAKKSARPTYTSPNRNSRGPQNDGLDKSEEQITRSKEKSSRERLQYTSISRQRPTTEKAADENEPVEVDNEKVAEEENASKRTSRKPSQPEYVTIRRSRPVTTTTEAEPKRNAAEVNIKLGEVEAVVEEISTQAPEYVTIRRQRPTTEKATTTKYITISRGTTAASQESTETPKSTTSTTIRAETSLTNTNEIKVVTPKSKTAVDENAANANKSNVPNLISSSSIDTTDKIVKSTEVQTEATITEKVTPHLFDPRPFSFTARKKPTSTTVTTTTPTPKIVRTRPHPLHRRTTTAKPKTTASHNISRSTKLPRRKVKPTPTSASSESQGQRTTTVPKQSPNRFRFPQRRKPNLKPTTTPSADNDYVEDDFDQTIESSNQQSLEEDVGQSIETTELSDIAVALQEIQQAPLRPKNQNRFTYTAFSHKYTLPQKPRPTTAAPKPSSTTRFVIKKQQPLAFEKILQTPKTFRQFPDYDYYDEGDARVVSRVIPEHSKVLIHSDGVIECLDQGNFPHPVSCKKFISCNKMYNNQVVGFEYTCPSYLSFDPVGGMCNWAAGVGCEEKRGVVS